MTDPIQLSAKDIKTRDEVRLALGEIYEEYIGPLRTALREIAANHNCSIGDAADAAYNVYPSVKVRLGIIAAAVDCAEADGKEPA